jgi:hypothetical protein
MPVGFCPVAGAGLVNLLLALSVVVLFCSQGIPHKWLLKQTIQVGTGKQQKPGLGETHDGESPGPHLLQIYTFGGFISYQ